MRVAVKTTFCSFRKATRWSNAPARLRTSWFDEMQPARYIVRLVSENRRFDQTLRLLVQLVYRAPSRF